MKRAQPFRAAIFDMDGVLTRTAAIHERAWKRVFDEFLQGRGAQRRFSSADYRAHVDGKPRYRGVEDFLRSREIELPEGDPSDGPDASTVHGLGNRKNQLFLQLLSREGVEVFDDAVAALGRWRRGDMRVAVVSSSKNCRRVLEAAALEQRFHVIVDGQTAEELDLRGKPGILAEAARRLDVARSDTVVLEDATAGVRAAREQGFGFVVGVSRGGGDRELCDAGAHVVAHDVYRVRFPRQLPSALERMQQLSAWRRDRPLALFVDFDGTLAPIVDDPADAKIPDAARAALSRIRCPIAIVSGRDRDDVQARVGIDGVYYAGNHGFDVAGAGQRHALPEAEAALGEVRQAEAELEDRLGDFAGVIIERKRYSVAVHHRKVEEKSVLDEVRRAVDEVREKTGLRKRLGKKVFELEPAVDWDKGRALEWLVGVLPVGADREPFVVYIGDDETDEDAFAVLREDGAGIRVGDAIASSLADYHVRGPDEVQRVLSALADLCDDGRPTGG